MTGVKNALLRIVSGARRKSERLSQKLMQAEAEDPLVHSLPACAGYRRECLEAFPGDCDVVRPSGDGGKAVTARLIGHRAADWSPGW